ncbi:MAG: hypothetical protein ROZ00_16365 [Denitratisoma sp.]|nr:hypothetical protein [Denitratisoma sp.]
MRILMFLGFLVLSVLVPVGLAQAEMPASSGWQAIGSIVCMTGLENTPIRQFLPAAARRHTIERKQQII